MSGEFHLEIRGKEVTNPVVKTLAAVVLVPVAAGAAAIGALVAFIAPALFGLALVVSIPVWVPLHFILKALGRKGFVEYNSRTDYFTLTMNRSAFQRVN